MTTIAQISDLHVRASDDLEDSRWTALRESLAQHSIDVLVATGDFIELPTFRKKPAIATFQRVHSYLLGLCAKLDLRPEDSLLVVPGNHDVRRSGYKLFCGWALADFKHVFQNQYPAYRYFPNLKTCFFLLDSGPLPQGDCLSWSRQSTNSLFLLRPAATRSRS